MLIPADVAKALLAVKHTNPKYFFWSGTSKISSITGFWRARIAKVFKLAGFKTHTHIVFVTRSRYPCSRRGTLENVSTLLGHQSVRVTEKHYSPWVQTRQDALDKAVAKALRSRKT